MACVKVGHPTRAAARAAARLFPAEKGLREYRCPLCSSWHLGHLPRSVRKGRLTAKDIYGEAE